MAAWGGRKGGKEEELTLDPTSPKEVEFCLLTDIFIFIIVFFTPNKWVFN